MRQNSWLFVFKSGYDVTKTKQPPETLHFHTKGEYQAVREAAEKTDGGDLRLLKTS